MPNPVHTLFYTVQIRSFVLLLLAMLFSLPLNAAVALQDESPAVNLKLTAEEQAWLKVHKKISVAYDHDFPPYSFADDQGNVKGIAVEMLALIGNRLGIEFETYPKSQWAEIYQDATDKKVDVVATMVNRHERLAWFDFTLPYLSKSLVIVTTKKNKDIKYRSDIANNTIALTKNYEYVERVLEEFPSITPYYVDTFLAGLNAVKSGNADAFITFTGTAHFLIDKHKLDDLKIAAFYDHNSANESIAVRKDWPQLKAILQKALNSISIQEKRKIFNKWVPETEVKPDYAMIGKIAAVFLLIVFFLVFRIRNIRKQNKKIIESENAAIKANEELKKLQNDLENLVYQRTEELKKSETRYRNLVENLRHEYFFYSHNLNGVMTYVSPSIADVLGYTPDEFIADHRDLLTNNPENLKINKFTELCILGEQQPPYEIEIYDNGGKVHWLEVLDTPLYDDFGNCIGVDGIAHDITARKETSDLLTSLSYYDDLTGLANRRLFLDRLQQSINLAHRNQSSLALLYLDVDQFKAVNDTKGHAVGDEVLKETARRMVTVLRDSDIAARMGGDEFVILLPDTGAEAAILVVTKLLKELRTPYHFDDNILKLGTSIGVSIYPQHGIDPEALLNHADTAMYHAKKTGQGYAFFTDNMQYVSIGMSQLTDDLTTAVDTLTHTENSKKNQNQFLIFYQSRHALKSGEILGFEALIRWLHPKEGIIAPNEFITISEKNALAVNLTEWIIYQTCVQALAWKKTGLFEGTISINLCPSFLSQQHLETNLGNILTATQCRAELLELEINEDILLNDPDTVIKNMHRLKALGFNLAIDNFGSAQPLFELEKVPVNVITIDRTMIQDIPSNQENAERVEAIIRLAHSAKKTVIAKGVESKQQLEFLKKHKCDAIQGYLYSKPLPASEAGTFLKNLPWFLDDSDLTKN